MSRADLSPCEPALGSDLITDRLIQAAEPGSMLLAVTEATEGQSVATA